MAGSSRRSDYGEEFVERLRRDRFKKAYILVNGVSSEEEDEEFDFDDEDDEMASFAMGPPPPRPSSTHSSRRPPSIAASYSKRTTGTAYGFDARDLYFFGVLSELTDNFTPERAARLIARNAPPPEYRTLTSIERIAYLLYYSLYGRYLNIAKFHNIFNREFFKYTSAGDTERNAFVKICRHTLEEYKRRIIEQNKRAYKLTQKHLFSDERATPDSRASERPSICADESEERFSIESLPKEMMFHRAPHASVRFAPGGRIIYVDPEAGMSLVYIEDTKNFYRDLEGRRYVEMLENFKGPMMFGHTPPQTPLLFIQRQIDRILQSDVYRANPTSGDANDCLLIWYLLEMLVRQQGKVTGPDLARLLCSNQQYSSFSYQNFLGSNSSLAKRPGTDHVRQNSMESVREVDPQALDRVTRFLLGGHIEEAIESAINDGLLFDALLLAHRLFKNDQRKLDVIESRLMAHRSAQHPITTLVSVAADLPVPLLNNPTTDDTNGWRAHIAIVLANLHTQTAMNAVYHLGLALAQKEFNSAADFCFLSVNLLTGYDCFQTTIASEIDDQSRHRKHISLINASLPDDEFNSCITRFGWSILDYQATEIYDYALQLGNPNVQTVLSRSDEFVHARKQYAQLLDELGGFGYAVELYNKTGGGYQHARYPTSTPSPPQQIPSHQSKPLPATHTQPPFVQAHVTPTDQQNRNSIDQSTIVSTSQNIQQVLEVQHQQQTRQVQQQQQQKQYVDQSHQAKSVQSQQHEPIGVAHQSQQPQFLAFQPPVVTAPQLQEVHHQQDVRNSRSPSLDAYSHMQTNYPIPSQSFPNRSESDASDEEEDNEEEQSAEFMPSPLPFVVPTPPFFNPNSMPVVQNPPAETMEGVNVDNTDLRRTSISSVASRQPTQNPPIPKNDHLQQTSINKEQKSVEKNISGPSGGGFLGGLLSKIKPQGQKEMKLPDDKNPKIVWDAQLGKYVDQEQKNHPVEELPPPPISSVPLPQRQERRQDTSTPIPGQEQQLPNFPQMPDIPTVPPSAKTGGNQQRPFQGRARYANAWNS